MRECEGGVTDDGARDVRTNWMGEAGGVCAATGPTASAARPISARLNFMRRSSTLRGRLPSRAAARQRNIVMRTCLVGVVGSLNEVVHYLRSVDRECRAARALIQ